MTARLEAWAWWGKRPGSTHDYAIIDSSLSADGMRTADEQISRMRLGNPTGDERAGGLPWASFVPEHKDAYRYYVCWWDWTTARDTGGRPVIGVLYLRVAADKPLSYEGLARYARGAWETYQDGHGVPEPGAVVGGGAEALLKDPERRRWLVTAAALSMNAHLRITASSRPGWTDPERIAATFDAMTALVPAPIRSLLKLCTGTNRPDNGFFHVAVGWDSGEVANQIDPDGAPGLEPGSAAAVYRDAVDRVLTHHSLPELLAHLGSAGYPPPAKLGAEAAAGATGHLASIDRLAQVGDDLVRRRSVDTDEVRALVLGHTLAGRVGGDAHRAFLAHLLRHGTAADLDPVARNWLPAAAPDATEAFRDRARRQALSGDWVSGFAGLAERAGADDLVLGLLDGGAGPEAVTGLIIDLVARRVPLDRTRAWLLRPDHQRAASELVTQGADPAVQWLASGPHAPAWTHLLVGAGAGLAHTGGPVADAHWVEAALRIAVGRYPAAQVLSTLMPDLIAAATAGAVRTGDPIGRWLEELAPAGPAERAGADFVLLAAGHRQPPGVRAGSSFPRDGGYALHLVLLHNRYAAAAQRVRTDLAAALRDEDATADALVLLDHLGEVDQDHPDRWRTVAVEVARARPELLERPGAERLREHVLAIDPGLRRVAIERAVDKLCRAAAPAAELAPVLVDAYGNESDQKRLRASLAHWAGAGDDRWWELIRHAGHLHGPDAGEPYLWPGLDVVGPLLPGRERAVLYARLRRWTDEEEDRVEELAERWRRARQQLDAVTAYLPENHGGGPEPDEAVTEPTAPSWWRQFIPARFTRREPR
ncbi:hypothetical protein KOI35_12820 [Actinoplanes bogorensis]|uniref:Uncharacterized protein n=1 Tax=Paractinoplanes bogorensis TaxID=1610840 RepID=A0ABS5YLN5_9ACTN|nr:hypothetical protein [Actinoplanes bogorensis]MBU2664379.1 hypothetical protein [Actinoplanes bogorensis]